MLLDRLIRLKRLALYCSSSSLLCHSLQDLCHLDLSDAGTCKNGERQLVEVGELVLVRGLGEVADVGDVDSSLAEVVLCGFPLAFVPSIVIHRKRS